MLLTLYVLCILCEGLDGHSSGVILVKISSFLNPEGRDAAGSCCQRLTSILKSKSSNLKFLSLIKKFQFSKIEFLCSMHFEFSIILFGILICHFVILSFYHSVILSFCHFVILSFFHFVLDFQIS